MKSFLFAFIFYIILYCDYCLKIDFELSKIPHNDCLILAHGRPYPQRKLDQLNHGKPVEPDDYESALHLMCVFKERGFMSEDGIINKKVAKKIAATVMGGNKDAAEDLKKVEDCASQKSTQEETARSYYNCVSHIVEKLNADR